MDWRQALRARFVCRCSWLLLLQACSRTDDDRDFGAICESLADETSDVKVQVHVHNGRATDVFLWPGCARVNSDGFIRVDAFFPDAPQDPELNSGPYGTGMPAYGTWPDTGCLITCEDIRLGNCECVGECARWSSVRVVPGGTYTTEWPGILRVPRWIPRECIPDDDGKRVLFCRYVEGICEAERRAVPGRYAVRTLEAELYCDGSACECTPNESGWCPIGADLASFRASHHAIFEYPATEVHILIE